MNALSVFRPLIDLSRPWSRTWAGRNVFGTALLNAYSMAFPSVEDFVVRTFQRAMREVPAEQASRLEVEVQGFLAHAAVHRPLRARFNTHLAAQGLVNRWEPGLAEVFAEFDDRNVKHALAVCAALQHLSSLFSDWLLTHPDVLAGTEERLATLWFWHAADGADRRGISFELYRTLGGNETWRRRWYLKALRMHLTGLAQQIWSQLRFRRQVLSQRTWQGAWSLLFGPRGLIRFSLSAWKSYPSTGFHPGDTVGPLSRLWLDSHPDRLASVPFRRA